MWAILKFDKKNLEFLKREFQKKLGNDCKIYIPKIRVQRYKNNKLINKNFNLLGDYLFCFHKSFQNKNSTNFLKNSRGLKFFLDGFIESQKEISEFINKCKTSEDETGLLSKNFIELFANKKYIFSSGPFTGKIFQIINLQRNKINVLVGSIKTTLDKREFSFATV